MPTSVHIPAPLLAAVDRRARRLRMSRNKFVVRALEKELERDSEWSPGFFELFQDLDPEHERAIDEMVASIRSRRGRKPPPRL